MLTIEGTAADWSRWGASLPERPDADAALPFAPGLAGQLEAAGELVAAGALTGPAVAAIVCADGRGAPAVTGPPFAPARSFLAAYWIVDCDSAARAAEIAARIAAAPARDGRPLDLVVQVRPVMTAWCSEQ